MYLIQWDNLLYSCSFKIQYWLLFKYLMLWSKKGTFSESTWLIWLKSHYLVPAVFWKIQICWPVICKIVRFVPNFFKSWQRTLNSRLGKNITLSKFQEKILMCYLGTLESMFVKLMKNLKFQKVVRILIFLKRFLFKSRMGM